MQEIAAQPVSATLRLVVLLAKLRLSAKDRICAEALAEEVGRTGEWASLFSISKRNFSLPLLRRHLAGLDLPSLPEDVRRVVETGADAAALRNMQIAVALRRFSQRCLEPDGIDGLFFKGISLGIRHYQDIGLRPARDVDVLVRPGAVGQALRRAATEGYALVTPEGTVRPLAQERDVRAVLRLSRAATLCGPDGVLVDLQGTLDKNSGLFSGIDPFHEAATFTLAGNSYRTLPDALMFNYLCHHHARHGWSHLHWLSDLDAVAGAATFDRQAVLATARRLGQEGTVEGSLELHELMSKPAQWETCEDLWRGRLFLDLALRNLVGAVALEKRIAFRMVGGEFMFAWQARPALRRRARRRWWWRVLRPTLREYDRRPLPGVLHWLYIVPRAVDLIRQRRRRVGAKDADLPSVEDTRQEDTV